MLRCRTKSGELLLRHEGRDYLLTGEGLDLPVELAESIRTHVNVEVVEPAAEEPAARRRKPRDEPEPAE